CSIIINVKNGQRYLARCLNALVKFEEVILLDNLSTDDTLNIARQYPNVKIYSSEFLGMGRVRNLAASFAKNDWVFFVDCDEVLDNNLTEYLLMGELTRRTIYKVRRYNYYDNYRLESSAWENDWVLRIYNRHDTRFVENEVHDSFVMDGLSIRKIPIGSIYHFPYENVNGLIDKMQFYSMLYARQFAGKKKPRLYTLPVRAFLMFIKCYILKRGFLDGYEGLLVSSYNAMGVFSKYIKLYELSYKKTIILVIPIEEVNQVKQICTSLNKQRLLPSRIIFLAKNVTDKDVISNLVKINLVIDYNVLLAGDNNAFDIIKHFVDQDLRVKVDNILYLKQSDVIKDNRYFAQVKKMIIKKQDIGKFNIVDINLDN
ncbi:MAG: glycosyltransferase family 2 protein, partial [Burkholderiales bacterium]|nr:glycosyltransferase family 2 protein [Burkholderiales bacterium]